MIPWLSGASLLFPDPNSALSEPDGLLAAGGDLSPERLIAAYRAGIFPWFSDEDPILWWSPNPRCVLRPEEIHISRSMKKHLRKAAVQIKVDTAFTKVIQQCATSRSDRQGTWITDEMMAAYKELHRRGIAHSIEVWQADQLVGGLYGLSIGKLFFGESMFSLQPNMSKVAFIFLASYLKEHGFPLIDCQVHNDHLVSLGAKNISRKEFLHYIDQYIDQEPGDIWSTLSAPTLNSERE